MAQFLLPTSDTATGSWSTTPLWSKVDDDSSVNPSGDGTTISSDNNTSPDNADFALTTGTDPETGSGHILRARWNKDASGGHQIDADLELWQGTPGTGTLIATLSVVDIGATETESTYELTTTEANNISDYSALSLRVVRGGEKGGPGNSRRVLVVDLVELETPDPVFNTDDERAAEIAGVDTASAERSAELEGGLRETDNRPAEITGVYSWKIQRSADGGAWQDIETEIQIEETTGTYNYTDTGPLTNGVQYCYRVKNIPDDSNYSNEDCVNFSSGTSVNDERSAELTGEESANAERSAETTGQNTANAERGAETEGVQGADDERSAETTGIDTSNDERGVELTGSLSDDDTRGAELTGQDTANDERGAEVHGQDTASDTRAAQVEGVQGSNDERGAELTGIDTTEDTRSAEVTGSQTADAERGAQVDGQAQENSERGAELEGEGDGPPVTSGMVVHLDATLITGLNDDEDVATWEDQTANSNDAAQSTASQRPHYKTNILNGKPVVRFDDANSERLEIPNDTTIDLVDEATVFVVTVPRDVRESGSGFPGILAKGSSSNRQYWLWQVNYEDAVSAQFGTTNIQPGGVDSILVQDEPSQFTLFGNVADNIQTLRHNRTQIVTNTTNTATTENVPIYLGFMDSFAYYTGDIAEVIIYDRRLSSTEIDDVEDYLFLKWFATETDDERGAELEGEAAGTETDDTRAAELHGTDTANNERGAETHGQDTDNAERSAEVHGSQDDNDTRSAETTGEDTANDTRSAETTGSLDDSDTRGAELTGEDTVQNDRSSEVHGQDTVSDTRAAEVEGVQGANDTRSAELTGTDTDADTRAAEVTGSQDADDDRSAELTGENTATSDRNAETTGQDTDSDERGAEIEGANTANAERGAETTGEATDNDTRGAETTGQDTANDDRPAELTGQVTDSDTRAAELTGTFSANDERGAELDGAQAASDTRGAEVDGTLTSSDTRNAEIEGTQEVTDTRSAEITGRIKDPYCPQDSPYTKKTSKYSKKDGIYAAKTNPYTSKDVYNPPVPKDC